MDQCRPCQPEADHSAGSGSLPANTDEPRFAEAGTSSDQPALWTAPDALSAELTGAIDPPAGALLAVATLGEVLSRALQALTYAGLAG